MPAGKKQPMISQANRPTAIDYDAPITGFKLRDLVAVVNSQMLEYLKYTPQPEHLKPEIFKPEHIKPEKEIFKPEKELSKPEKEILKAEKEVVKPEKELLKPEKERVKPEVSKPPPEKEWEIQDPEIARLVESIAIRVVEMLKKQGIGK